MLTAYLSSFLLKTVLQLLLKSRAIEDDVGFEVVTSDLGDSFEHLTVTKNTNNSKNLNLMRFLLVQLELMMEDSFEHLTLTKNPNTSKKPQFNEIFTRTIGVDDGDSRHEIMLNENREYRIYSYYGSKSVPLQCSLGNSGTFGSEVNSCNVAFNRVQLNVSGFITLNLDKERKMIFRGD